MKRALVALILGLISVAAPGWAQRTDVVFMKNGEQLTCSVKQLERGRLRVETDHMGTVFIGWTHVSGIQAAKIYEVELDSGETFYGNLQADLAAGLLGIRSGEDVEQLPIDRIVNVTEIKSGFFKRLDGSLDFGFSFKKADNEVNYSIGANASFRTKRNDTSIRYSSVLSSRNSAPRTFRNVIEGTYTHFLKARWYVAGTTRAEQNDELGLDLRTALGGGFGKYVIQSNRTILGVAAGLTSNREKYQTDPEGTTSIEALANLSFDYFIHGDLGADISTQLTLFPSLTESGRYRLEFDFRYRQEIVTDLSVSLRGWYSFDSRAPIGTDNSVKQDDYGVVTSLGWDF